MLFAGKRRIPCVRPQRGQSEVFIPFNAFLRQRFDLYGQFGEGYQLIKNPTLF
jgi:hypothetical protein